MSKYLWAILCWLFLAGTGSALGHPHILRLSDRAVISFEEMVNDLASARIIFMGELHNHVGHHQAQLAVIDALRQSGAEISIGLEMFRQEDQPALDLWSASRISERDFVEIYRQNWSLWPVYRDIFTYAQAYQVPLAGLNISREITRQVAAEGIGSLSKQQGEILGNLACVIDPIYMEYIRRAMGGHGGQGNSFLHFCEAQLLWDIAMGRNLSQWLESRPDTQAIVLAGSGHSWKYGIPSRIDAQTYPFRVILPEIHGRVDRANATGEDADYLWLDEGMDGWTAPQ
jgi:uncharacterized iron-regulated protein